MQMIIEIPPFEVQGILKGLAVAFSNTDGTHLFIIDDKIQKLRSYLGDQCLKDYFKEDYENIMNIYAKLRIKINDLQFYFRYPNKISIDENKDDITSPRYKECLKKFIDLNMQSRILYKILSVLIINTRYLKDQEIKREYWICEGTINPLVKQRRREEQETYYSERGF